VRSAAPVLLALAASAALAGCSTAKDDAFVAPPLSPVGSGLYQYPAVVQPAAFPAPPAVGNHSLWADTRADFFQDPRALAIGDIVTVEIKIKDKAALDNDSERSRQSGIGATLEGSPTFNGDAFLGSLGGGLDLTGKSTAKGKGKVSRSEEIDLQVAAVVTQKLPNGNLFITGQQEVQVNYEVRVLSIAGIIRPRDILPDNTISYEKIAEARIAYGGRGRLTEAQQPGWGQQVYDTVMPW
jgi:flagellar L-ring protein FlgH